ncbi:hypothetical protein CBR_g48603 [Chara braunii]|uniref:Uncharacterized protein n=1 Tax=Chara braunii TaxID=69332 RepID=A0A388M3F6_CHABU|nr:hypothetical protein CBR_g48603 [Chara braunii]|eukprot:GBG88993.1 hypothetical protein CBR_g48603 [Chara braunii]
MDYVRDMRQRVMEYYRAGGDNTASRRRVIVTSAAVVGGAWLFMRRRNQVSRGTKVPTPSNQTAHRSGLDTHEGPTSKTAPRK